MRYFSVSNKVFRTITVIKIYCVYLLYTNLINNHNLKFGEKPLVPVHIRILADPTVVQKSEINGRIERSSSHLIWDTLPSVSDVGLNGELAG